MSSTDTPAGHGRIAVRSIRDEVHFFYAMPDTMKGALLLGTVKANILRGHPARFDAMLAIYREAVTDMIEAATGARIEFDQPQRAPEHERGHGAWRGDA